MRLDLLIQRENFTKVFSETFQKILSNQYNWSGQISWQQNKWSLKTQVLRINYKLNVIYPASLNKHDLRHLTNEYVYHPNTIRRLLQFIFVRLGIAFPLEILTTAIIQVSPWIDDLNRCCIIPGNHSLRIVELDQKRCRVFLKQGFNQYFIQNEITVRREYPFLPSPKLLDWDQDGKWYLEERIIALPLNRIASQKVRMELLLQAQSALFQLYQKSQRTEPLADWKVKMTSQINEAIDALPLVYMEFNRKVLTRISERLMNFLNNAEVEWIDTVQSHGDFQPANILLSTENGESQLYLIDWEYSTRRCRIYDALVFASRSRFPDGLADRLKVLISGDLLKDQVEDWSWCYSQESQPRLEYWMVAIFLLEDLLVRLQELQIPDLKQQGKGLSIWLDEVNTLCGENIVFQD